ncbi:MAG: outer membrane protein assembly factor BamD [Proteobacteria bacterium]|nr:outer membrane protein assembly factor BamD [Pseudomonadota bacterium]MCH9047518.1 outer membrane protein assembly factor BamD [Pseudomonadota bacterium]
MKKTIASFLTILALSACSYFEEKEDLTEKWPAERLYAEARGALDAGSYDKAVELYEKLEARFPFGTYGQQAILDLAYAYHKNDEPDAAISTAERFIKLYPQNAHVDYAYYLKGLTNFQRGKGFTERIISLDESQRDPASSLRAFEDFSELVKRYPDSQYAEDAKLRMTYLRNILAEHEIHVAHYYMRRGAFVAAANRARYVVERYPRTPSIPDALVIMAKAYKVMELTELSTDALRVLELNYPNHPGLYEVREILIQ